MDLAEIRMLKSFKNHKDFVIKAFDRPVILTGADTDAEDL